MSTASDQTIPAQCPECAGTTAADLWWCPQCYADLRPTSPPLDDATVPIPLPRRAPGPVWGSLGPEEEGRTPDPRDPQDPEDLDTIADQMVSRLAAAQPASRLGRARTGREQAAIALVAGSALLVLVVAGLAVVGLLV